MTSCSDRDFLGMAESASDNELQPVWAYHTPDKDEYDSLKNAELELTSSPQLFRTNERIKTFHVVCVSVNDSNEIKELDSLCFDYTMQVVSLESKNITISAAEIQTVLPVSSASTSKLMVTYQEEVKVKILHFMTEEGEMDRLLIINAFRRLLFEFYRKFTANDRDVVNMIDNFVPSFVGVIAISVKKKGDVKGIPSENATGDMLHVVLDAFSMGLFRYSFSCEPLYVLYFWNLPGECVVEKVLLEKDTNKVTLETIDHSFEIRNASTQCPQFLKAIREIRPKSKDVFSDPEKLVQYYINLTKPRDQRKGIPSVNRDSVPGASVLWDTNAGRFDEVESTESRLRSFHESLNHASSKFKDNEEINLPWIVAEEEINELLTSGFVPEIDFASGGLDPNNLDHFFKCIDDIEDHLLQQRYDMALSRLQGTRLTFSESALKEMRDLFREKDDILIKKIYYRSFLQN